MLVWLLAFGIVRQCSTRSRLVVAAANEEIDLSPKPVFLESMLRYAQITETIVKPIKNLRFCFLEPLGVSPPLHLQKIDPKLVQAASTTASCSIFDPKMVPNWRKRTAVWMHTTSIILQSLSGSHFPHLFLTIHRFTYHMDFSKALHSMKAQL